MTTDEFEPSQVGSTETGTGGLTGSEPPAAPAQPPPGGSTTSPSLTPEEAEGIDPTAPLDPTDMGNESAGSKDSDTLASDVGPGVGVEPADAGALDASTPDTTLPDASVPPPSAVPLDASTATADPSRFGEAEPGRPCLGIVFGESCYRFFAEPLSWNVAEERCVAWDGHLASVESSEEDVFIGSWPALLGVPVGNGSGLWLGGSDAGQDGDFRWAGDRPLSFVGWAPNQPDNGQGVDCIQKRNDGTGRWYDLRCTDGQPYVCERAQG